MLIINTVVRSVLRTSKEISIILYMYIDLPISIDEREITILLIYTSEKSHLHCVGKISKCEAWDG